MGLFSSLFGKPKTLKEKLEEKHTTSWYASNSSELFRNVLMTRNSELIDAGVNLICKGFFDSLVNVNNLVNCGKRVDTYMLAKELSCLILRIFDKYSSNMVHQSFFAMQTFKEDNSSLVRFAKKLNHNFYGTTAFYIIHLILLGYIDVDRDTWLYDAKLFEVDPSTDEEGDKLYDKVSPILIEKNLLTEEILKEIEDNMN